MTISSLRRLYIPFSDPATGTFTLDAESAHRVTNVLRIRNNEYIRIFNEKHGEFKAKIFCTNKKCTAELNEIIRKPIKPTFNLKLAIALIKPDRFLQAIEKAVELGVTTLQPIKSEYSQFSSFNREKCTNRIISAIEQSERLDMVSLLDLKNLQEFVKYDLSSLNLFCNERESSRSLLDINIQGSKDITVIIGPEGGFSSNELKLLERSNIHSVTLSKHILRTETAVAAALAQIQMLRHHES